MIYRSHKLSIRRQAELLKISRGAAYYLPKPCERVGLRLDARHGPATPRLPLHGFQTVVPPVAGQRLQSRTSTYTHAHV